MAERKPGRLFNEVPELYDRVRPGYPDGLFADLVDITGVGAGADVLEVGCGTGQATRSLAGLGWRVTAVEAGAEMAALARRRLAAATDVVVEASTFEEWDDRGRRFDLVVAASSWHWVDPSIGWPKAHTMLRDGGWMAILGHVVVSRPSEPEAYAETADSDTVSEQAEENPRSTGPGRVGAGRRVLLGGLRLLDIDRYETPGGLERVRDIGSSGTPP